ncbi:hypothetical protein NDU88_008249 [Pleurodeles waltl]|uniref:Uncharacterized protein n=1 Tax=Pleurodeles waltl TaxID=8319 RepID=A0AAV7PTU3_PLEWA|nr:hypothetical protein NDU88_008249 [Pleurodeles waltl]
MGLSEEEEREGEDSQAHRSREQTREEDPKTTCGEYGGDPKDSSFVAEERDSVEASHIPRGTWLLQVRDLVCGVLTKLIGKVGREQGGGLGTTEHHT